MTPRPPKTPSPRLAALAALATLGLGWLAAPPAAAQFRPAEVVGRASGAHDLHVDHFGVLNIAYVQATGDLVLELRGGGLDLRLDIASGLASGAGAPRLASSPSGITLAFAAPGAGGLEEIVLVTRLGPVLGEPLRLSPPGVEARHPALRLGRGGRPIAAWEETRGGGEPEVVVLPPGLPARSLGPGRHPSVEVDRHGRLHAFFVRDGTIHHASDTGREPGSFPEPRPVLGNRVTSPPRTGILDGERLYVAYVEDGALFLADDRTGRFEARRIDDGGVGAPSLRVTPGGLVALAYELRGDIYHVLGNSFFLSDPAPVTRSVETESSPDVDVDTFANVFVSFLRDGELHLTTNAGPPLARFSLDPLRGEAPLEVRFTDTSRGDVSLWRWDFGDGATSTRRHPVHVYARSGEYRVRLSVSGPGGESPLTHEETVRVTGPGNRLWIADTRAFPGQRGLHIPVLATHDGPAQGFQIAATFDPSFIEVVDVRLGDTNVDGFEPELQEYNVTDGPGGSFVTLGVLFDIEPPFDRRVLAPGRAQRIANIVVNVSSSVALGESTEVALKNGLGRPPINNIFIVMASTVLPVLGKPGKVSIEDRLVPPPRFFVRGDSDWNGRVAVSDAIATLNFLFVGHDSPECLDAADMTDNGRLDITDALYTLNFLFRAGSYPPPPYPDAGLDPSPDELGTCSF
ncbi:MAG: PKD domain-containing protein [Planctomycetota bacterium]|nr:PKD domain-containing protein [Planctomycetota bacterium]